MTKFGQYLEREVVPEWYGALVRCCVRIVSLCVCVRVRHDKYIHYKRLKQLLKAIEK